MVKQPEINFLSGSEACAQGAIALGCKFFAASPASHGGGIANYMAGHLPDAGGVFLDMENDTAAIAGCIGASWAGLKVMANVCASGLSDGADAISFAIRTETPLVIVDIPSAQSGLQQARWGVRGDYQLIVLAPSSAQEMYELTVEAFNFSEALRVPVVVLADSEIARTKENVSTKKAIKIINRSKRKDAPVFGAARTDTVAPMPPLGSGQNLSISGFVHDEYGMPKVANAAATAKLFERLQNKILSNAKEIIKAESQIPEDSKIILVSYGICARASSAAMKLARKEGYKVGTLRLKTLWPFADEIIKKFCDGKKVIVPEMSKGQLSRELQRCLRADVVPLLKTDGEAITPLEILEKIRKVSQ
ncbi:MAG: 2-oxoacid:acceptor oxidoreductase subunit alpha [Candidatus Omnitrophota bacterium]